MKILYIINQISDWSGDSGLVWMSAKHMKEKGHEVAIATTDGNPFKDQKSFDKYSKTVKKLSDPNDTLVIIDDIPVFPVHSISSHFGMYSFNASSMAKKIVVNFDIIHIYSWYHHIGIEFFKAAKKFNIPLVFSAMGTLQSDAQNFYKTQKSIIDLFYTKKIIDYSSVLHSVGNSEVKSYLQYGGKKEKIVQVENGINLKDFELTNTSDILKKINIENKQYILFLSRIHPKKGLELLLDSFNELCKTNTEIFLVISGTGKKDYVDQIKKIVKDLGLIERVKFTGLVSHNEKLTLLKFAKLFSLTSKSDIYPRAIQEALAMGVPVVVSKESDYPEVEEYQAGVLVNLNHKEISNVFSKVLTDEEKLTRFSRNAKKLIHEKFLVEYQIDKFEMTYTKILSKQNIT